MEPAPPIRISASGIRAYQSCAYRYALDYIERLPAHEREPVPPFAVGDAVHKALAQFIRLGGWRTRSLDDLIELLMRHWDSRVHGDEEISHMHFTRCREQLEVFYQNPYPVVVAHEADVEKYVAWSRPRKGILATGRLDRTCLLPDGTLEVIDYKTGRCRLTDEELAREIQAIFYRTLAAEVYQRLSPAVIRVTFLYLEDLVPISVEYAQEDFMYLWSTVEAVVANIRRDRLHYQRGFPLQEAFPLNRGEHCRFCPMRRHCGGISHQSQA